MQSFMQKRHEVLFHMENDKTNVSSVLMTHETEGVQLSGKQPKGSQKLELLHEKKTQSWALQNQGAKKVTSEGKDRPITTRVQKTTLFRKCS